MSRQKLLLGLISLGLLGNVPFVGAAPGSQNPGLTVAVSLVPAQVTAGQTATASGSVTNNTGARQRVTVTLTFTFPDGSKASKARVVSISAGKTVSLSRSLKIETSHFKGNYTLTVSAATSAGTSWASAPIQIQ